MESYQQTAEDWSFALKDLKGRTHSLDSYRGEVVLVNFWASWCVPCLREFPYLKRLSNALNDERFTILAIDVGEQAPLVKRRVQRFKIDFTVLLDPEQSVFDQWQGTILPTSYLIDSTGHLRYRVQGPIEWDQDGIIDTIKALLNEQQPSQTD